MKPPRLFIYGIAALAFLAATKLQSADPKKPETPAADTVIGNESGQVRDDNGLKLKLVWCPPGFLTMETLEVIAESIGDDPKSEPAAKNDDVAIDDEVAPKNAPVPRQTEKITPVKVFVTKGYWLGKYEVTQFEWKQVMQTEPWTVIALRQEGADFPATFVSWDDATEFCRKLTQQEREAGRLSNDWEYTLPTEAQWERGCRARTETSFSFGNDESKLGNYAWFDGTASSAGEKYAHRVGQKKANQWGLFDMHGNVWEWCRDVYTQKLPGGRDPEVKADEKTKGFDRVHRGGGWFNFAYFCRSAYRGRFAPSFRSNDLGFRVALIPVR